jgi:hypothetical protein
LLWAIAEEAKTRMTAAVPRVFPRVETMEVGLIGGFAFPYYKTPV